MYMYLRVVRPEGADSPPRPATAAEMARIRAGIDSLRRLRPARVDSVFNGADDDGSGSVSVLEIAEALAAAPPRRSVLFVFHTAEELGLIGADHFTRNPTVPRDSIVAQLNIDMIGRGGTASAGNDVALIGAKRLSTQFGEAIDRVNARGHNVRFNLSYDANGHPQQFYCRSDHYMYARYDIPIAFFFTGVHPDYHQLTDEPQYINYPHMARIARLIKDVATEVGNLDRRPVVDRPGPGPEGTCRQ
jgi:Zn-dependent M28 family amino/carboxypeptidase